MTTSTLSFIPSPPQALSFAPSMHVRAFLLPRTAGNVVIYSADGLGNAFGASAVARQYLTHSHEAMFSAEGVDAPVFMHEADAPAVGDALPVRGTFSRRHALGDDFEAIPIPGHTPGSTAYLWDDGERRHLFTGDTIYLDGDEWVGGLLESSDRTAFMASLELLSELEVDVLVPWAATVGGPWHAETDRADTRRRIGAIVEGLR